MLQTRRYTHLTVEQMREGFKKLDAAVPIRVAPGVPIALARSVAMPAHSRVVAAHLLSANPVVVQPDAPRSPAATDAGLTPNPSAKT